MPGSKRTVLGTCPELLSVGRAPYVVTWRDEKPTVYTDGLQLKIVMGEELELVETLRVVNNSVVEYQFECDGMTGIWSNVRSQAFSDCVNKAKKTLPQQRSVIFGPSHMVIQSAVVKAFPQALQTSVTVESPRHKRISWGDEANKVVDEADGTHRYGGWGLATYQIIPNRDELRAMNASWSDIVLDSEDIEYFALDDEDRDILVDQEMQTFSLFSNDPFESARPSEPKTTLVHEGSTSEIIQEEVSDEDERSSDEETASSQAPSRKRVRMIELSQDNDRIMNNTMEDTNNNNNTSCKPFEEELKEYDFWLLQNEQIY